MFARKTATAIALAAAVLLSTTGCSLTHNVATEQMYAPADGTQADNGIVGIRNAFILVKDGKVALFASLVNSGIATSQADLQYTDQSGKVVTVSNSLMAGEKLDLGYSSNAPLMLDLPSNLTDPATVIPGSVVEMYLLDQVHPGVKINVPVLDGTQPLYAELLAEIK